MHILNVGISYRLYDIVTIGIENVVTSFSMTIGIGNKI